MKKLLLLTAALAVSCAASALTLETLPQPEDNAVPVKMENLLPMTPQVEKEMIEEAIGQMKLSGLKATPSLPITTIDDLVGTYDWTYRTYTGGGYSTQPDTLAGVDRDAAPTTKHVGLSVRNANTVGITSMWGYPITATIDFETYSSPTLRFSTTDSVNYSSTYGKCILRAIYQSSNDGKWYKTTPVAFIQSSRLIFATNQLLFYEIATEGQYKGSRLGRIYEAGSTMIPNADYNGLCAFDYTVSSSGIAARYEYPVKIAETDTENQIAITENFGGFSTCEPIVINLAADRTFTMPAGQFMFTSNSKDFSFYALSGSNRVDGTGVGTDNTLTLDQDWSGYSADFKSWYGRRSNLVITKVDSDFPWPVVAPTSIMLNVDDADEVALRAGETFQLEVVAVEPEYASKEVTWSVSDDAIATVDENGLVTAKVFNSNELMSARFRAPSDGDNYDYLPVTVTATAVATEATFEPATASVTLWVKSSVATGIDSVKAETVKNVKYVNAQGMTSDTPFDGINIVVKTMTDGSVKVSKAVK